MNDPADLTKTLDEMIREDGGRILSALIAQLRDIQLAEDSLHDAVESALVHWSRSGLPVSPMGWLLQAARRKAIDRLRRVANFQSKQGEIAYLAELDAEEELMEQFDIPDERLRLIFTCCHPALAQEASVALTLRTLCGLSTEELARAFVVPVSTMAQRLVRAKSKIKKSGIAFEVPEKDVLDARLWAVLDVLYLVFNAGHAAEHSGSTELTDLPEATDFCAEGLRLTRILNDLQPDTPEIEGLLALMLLHGSRANARFDQMGHMVALEAQDRTLWQKSMIDEGLVILHRALRRQRPGPFQVQGAIAAIHAEAETFEDTDWREIAMLYETLENMRPNPVVTLNRIAAISHARDAEVALVALEAIRAQLTHYQPFHAVEADLRRRVGDFDGAASAYQIAAELSQSEGEIAFLLDRKRKLLN